MSHTIEAISVRLDLHQHDKLHKGDVSLPEISPLEAINVGCSGNLLLLDVIGVYHECYLFLRVIVGEGGLSAGESHQNLLRVL
jgi:hypothetical protein